MGSSKALLVAEGRTFLNRVVQALRDGGADPILVVVRDLAGREAEEAEALNAMAVLNPDPSAGPISSLQSGIRALPNNPPGILFTPVDHPLFRSASVDALVRAFLEALPPVAAPSHEGRPGHPVIFGQRLFPELLQKGLPQGARSVVRRYLQERLLVPVDDPGILADIDTPEDYRRHFSSE